jgi:hypothetical protein
MESQGAAITEVVEDYTELGTWLVQRWSAHASKVATRLDAGDYDADSAAADLAACASLAAESWARVAWEAIDAAAILTGQEYEPEVIDSDPFSSPIPGATLTLQGPLVGAFGNELPTDVIEIIPSQLGPNATQFRLRADATGHPGGTYLGRVVASKPGRADAGVRVLVTVP